MGAVTMQASWCSCDTTNLWTDLEALQQSLVSMMECQQDLQTHNNHPLRDFLDSHQTERTEQHQMYLQDMES
jgi:regulator of replication initiation timing